MYQVMAQCLRPRPRTVSYLTSSPQLLRWVAMVMPALLRWPLRQQQPLQLTVLCLTKASQDLCRHPAATLPQQTMQCLRLHQQAAAYLTSSLQRMHQVATVILSSMHLRQHLCLQAVQKRTAQC